jgi:hypothetical protein
VSAAARSLVVPIKAARRSPAERQASVRAADALTASKVFAYAREVRDMSAARLAIQLDCSVQDENQFEAEGFERGGETYSTAGQLVVPTTRISLACQKKQGARHRRVMKRMLESYMLLVGLAFRFYTLTLPNFNASFEVTLDIMQDALCRLKRSKIWRDNVEGAYDKVEWTGGKQEEVHHHVHAHLLLAARWLGKGDKRDEFTATWTRCVRASAEAHGVAWTLPRGRVLSVNLKTKTLPEMINEMTKYLAKPSDYARLSGAELVEIHRVLKGRRLFNSYGDFNANSGSGESIVKPNQTKVVQQMPNVHTGTQLNRMEDERAAQPSASSEVVEVWNEEELARWRDEYMQRVRLQRARRLTWLLSKHRRCRIRLGTGAQHYGSIRAGEMEEARAA